MALTLKYYAWMQQCAAVINARLYKERKRKRILAAAVLYEYGVRRSIYKEKRFWVDPVFKMRKEHGFYHVVFPTIALNGDKFRNYFRMTHIQFQTLLRLIGPSITKQAVIREPISAGERLALTIRYLASGDAITSMSYQYLIGVTTAAKIIRETCQAIWICLHDTVLPSSLSTDQWIDIAEAFEELWNFPHCIGAVDGKHILIQCPGNAGSLYFNYKYFHSIVLMAMCDAHYMFTFVDIGAYGRRSDGGVFKDSNMGRSFLNKSMNLPDPEEIAPNGQPIPYVLVGDEAFQLTDFLMKPYPGKTLNTERRIFNYRLSRARRIIENTFGILVVVWRVLKRPINCSITTTKKIVQAIVCLHNWLRLQDIGRDEYVTTTMVDRTIGRDVTPGSWRSFMKDSAFLDMNRLGSNNSSRRAQEIREEFCKFFNGIGAVSWQNFYCQY